jgi:phage host-nuclease inhibitor protein Gam
MAAGSRQQSRFIALMSDYKRTQELTTAANSAAGASTEQYNKTLESLETKLAKLKNAWDEFLMSIANNDLIKGVVDFATSIVSGLNKITDTISGKNGVLKSISAIGLAFGSLKLGKNFFKLLFGNPLTGSQSFIK